jgi:hypothetical protein
MFKVDTWRVLHNPKNENKVKTMKRLRNQLNQGVKVSMVLEFNNRRIDHRHLNQCTIRSLTVSAMRVFMKKLRKAVNVIRRKKRKRLNPQLRKYLKRLMMGYKI